MTMINLVQQFAAVAALGGERPALVEDARTVSYGELHACTARMVEALRAAGVGERMRVALEGVNSAEFVAAYLALATLGACVVPIDGRLSAAEVGAIVGDCAPNAYLLFGAASPLAAWLDGRDAGQGALTRSPIAGCAGAAATLVSDLAANPHGAALAGDLVIQYSSGSTGLPKGIILGSEAIAHKVGNWNATLEIGAGDVFLCTLTLSHCYGMYVHTLAGLLAGAKVVLPDLATLTPGRIARLIGEHGVTVFGTLPYMYQLLLALPAERLNLATVRYLISGSAPLPEVTATAFRDKFGRNLNQVYGLTEIGLITFNKTGDEPMSLGRLTANMQARVLDDQGQEAELGELVVRCPSMARGYLSNPEDQQAMFRDGWLYTKDIVRRMPDGTLQMCGRLSQFINVGGNKVAPGEVENALLSHAQVQEVAVVGRRHALTTEEVVAFVVARDRDAPPTPRELLAHCHKSLSPYKQPRDIRLVPSLPKSPLGKVLKAQLFEQFGADPA